MDDNKSNDQSAKWVANELHDGLMQWIFAAKLKVESLRSSSEKDTSYGLDEVMGILKVAHAEGRALIRHLEDAQTTSVNNPFALLADLVENLELLDSAEFHVKLDRTWFLEAAKFADADFACNSEVAWGIFRIGQQAIFNVLKHSQKADVVVSMCVSEPAALELVVEAQQVPQGESTESTAEAPSGFGIPSMKHRAAQLGGQLDLELRPDFSRVKLVVDF